MGDRIANGLVGIAKESTPGTFNAPDTEATNKAILPVLDLKIGDPEPVRVKLPIQGKYMGTGKSGPLLLIQREISFSLPFKGSGSLGVKPDFDWFLLACGLFREVTASTSVKYKPSTKLDGSTVTGPPVVDHPTNGGYSLGWYEDGRRYAIAGSMGNAKFSMKSDGVVMIDFSFKGLDQVEADIALPTVSTLDTTNPIPFINAGLAINFGTSYTAAILESLEFDLGNNLAAQKNANATLGANGIKIFNRAITGKFDPEMVAIASQDFYSQWKNGTVGTLSTGVMGSVSGNRAKIECLRVQHSKIGMGDREGYRTRPIDFEVQVAASGTEGDEFVITLT